MSDAHTTLHEPADKLQPETIELHRGIVSLIEELEAVDWYRQRADATGDRELRAIILHNMEEEIEHAVMTLEWLRRRIPKLDQELRTYLFTTGDVTEKEDESAGEALSAPPRATVGSLKETG